MSTRTVTPGGALLRASRVFAIPPALPKPQPQLSSRAIYNSDTATLPHPIRLSITTPQTSLMRGDWGFKRPLPLRSTTKSSTPLIRVERIDTYEHITEYGSSADHTINMQKWLEMGVPLTVPVVDDAAKVGGFRSGKRQSVFEDKLDYTTTPAEIGGRDDIRWKFKGPYLANQTDGDFAEYLSNQVRGRKLEFYDYLRKACATELTSRARRAVLDEEIPAAIASDAVTQDQLTAYIKELRGHKPHLFMHIRAFLDLPPVAPADPRSDPSPIIDLLANGFNNKPLQTDQYATSFSPYAKSGPPKTHPSAGLSYARSAAHTANHPSYGPQKRATTVKSRIIRPRAGGGGNFEATLGVAGWVTNLPAGADTFQTSKSRSGTDRASHPGAHNIEINKVGGSKLYLHPTHATVNPAGQVILVVEDADAEAVNVMENTTHLIPKAPEMPARRPNMMGPGGVFSGYGLSGSSDRQDSPFAARSPANGPAKSFDSLLDIQ